MTLVLAATGKESIWLLADRRLSSGDREPIDDGRKALVLETHDGAGMLGYAGLGATAAGTEPCDWMSAVLTGQGLTFEECLQQVASAMERNFGRHLQAIPKKYPPGHVVLAPCLYLHNEPRIYGITAMYLRHERKVKTRCTVLKGKYADNLRVAVSGTGGYYLTTREKLWRRRLYNLIKAHEAGKTSAYNVSSYLAELNYSVHKSICNESVGDRSIIMWKCARNGRYNGVGGVHFFTGVTQDARGAEIPAIVNGLDVVAIGNVFADGFRRRIEGAETLERVSELLNGADFEEYFSKLVEKSDVVSRKNPIETLK